MGLFSRFFAESKPETAPVEDPRLGGRDIVIQEEAKGSTGTAVYMGYPTEDYLQAMQGSQRADLMDKMRRSDPQISMILRAVTTPVLAASWEVQPGDASEEAKKDAEFVQHVLFNDLGKTWSEFLTEAVTLAPFGHAVFEKWYRPVIGHPVFGNYLAARLGWRNPRTLERWNVDEQGELKSVTQQADGDLNRNVDLDARFLMVFSLQKEGSNFEGISMLRACYGNFLRKGVYQKLNAIGIEKFAVPTPVADIPDEKADATNYARIKAMLRAYTSHQSNYIVKPKGLEITLHSNVYDPEKVEVSVDKEDQRMSKALLANFLELGMGSTGSYALSNDLSDFFLGGIEAFANIIAEGVTRGLVKDLVKLNRGPRAVYPKLVATGISDKVGKELAEVLQILTGAKILTPDTRLEVSLRKRFHLPEMDEATKRETNANPLGIPPGANPPKPEDEEEDEPKDEKAPPKEKDEEDAPKFSESSLLAQVRRARNRVA